jgi:hypothetical protein
MEIHIERDRMRDRLQIYLIDEGRGDRTFYSLDESGRVFSKVLPNTCAPDDTFKPFLELPLRFGEMLIELIVNNAASIGINPVKESTLQGKAEATETHLKSVQANFDKLLDAFINVPK